MAVVSVRADEDDELVRRYTWFREEAQNALNYFPLRGADVVVNSPALWQSARAHFLLMDAYKTDHFTGDRAEDAKIAATTALAIVTFKPFRVKDPNNVISHWAARANELFAVRLAGPILNSGLPELGEGDRMAWLLNFLATVKACSIDSYFDDVCSGRLSRTYEIELDQGGPNSPSDLSNLNILMLVYHILWRPANMPAPVSA